MVFCSCGREQERWCCCRSSFSLWRTLHHNDDTERQLLFGTSLPPLRAQLSEEIHCLHQVYSVTSPPPALSCQSYMSDPCCSCSCCLTRYPQKSWVKSPQGSAQASLLESLHHLLPPPLLPLSHLLPGCDWTCEGSWGCQSGSVPQSWEKGRGLQWTRWGSQSVSVWCHCCPVKTPSGCLHLETVCQIERGGAEWRNQTADLQTDTRRKHTEVTEMMTWHK